MFKVWVLASGERTWATNGIDHENIESAEKAARDLFSRWMAAKDWAVLPKSDNFVGHLTHNTINEHNVSRR
jgi:hypothetical protein